MNAKYFHSGGEIKESPIQANVVFEDNENILLF